MSKEGGSAMEFQLSHCTVELDPVTGDLIGVVWRDPELRVIDEPRLGENFRLLLPRPDYEATYFFSRDQKVDRILEEETGLVLEYSSLRNDSETVDVAVRYRITSTSEGIEFSIEIDNKTSRPIAEVFYGIVGGMNGIGTRSDSRSMVPGGHDNLVPNIFDTFPAGEYGGGNLGIRYSACGFLYPGYAGLTMSWMSLYNESSGIGLYYGSHDPQTRLTGLYFELRPFTNSAVLRSNWPTRDDVPEDEPIGLTMGWLNFPYVAQGTIELGPVRLQVHPGDWRTGSKIYRHWFDQHFPVVPTSWLRREMAWQSTIMRNPEDVSIHHFADLPSMAVDAKKYDVTTFEICGWDAGGIDRGYPDYTPDPKLGSRADFRAALDGIREAGVKPVVFANLQVADTATDEFRTTLHKYAVHGRWAPDLHMLGFGEGTISARLGLTQSNMAIMNLSHDEFRSPLVDQLVDLVRDGAAALQLDKTIVTQFLDFADPSGFPDRGVASGLLAALDEVLTRGREIDPDFALASEVWWDRTFQYQSVMYSRMVDIDIPHPALVYTFPEVTSTIFAENPADFNVLSNGMRYGMVWAIAPRHYNDSLDERLTQPLARYLRELIRIRSRFAGLLFLGRFQDADGAVVNSHPALRHSVFRDASDRQASVLVNYGDEPLEATVDWTAGLQVDVCQPFEPDRVTVLPATVTIAPRSCAVVVESDTRK
ncbi:MAG TPA: DUF6259 domain-containing protein [Pseudolysinimonas sp.]